MKSSRSSSPQENPAINDLSVSGSRDRYRKAEGSRRGGVFIRKRLNHLHLPQLLARKHHAPTGFCWRTSLLQITKQPIRLLSVQLWGGFDRSGHGGSVQVTARTLPLQGLEGHRAVVLLIAFLSYGANVATSRGSRGSRVGRSRT